MIDPSHATPVDRVAARVLGKGTHFVSGLKNQGAVWKEMPPTAPLPRHYRDLKGIAFGRLVVVGYAGKRMRRGQHSNRWWICRCTCGNFCTVHDDTVFQGEEGCAKEPNMCSECNHVYYTLRQSQEKL